MSPGGEIQLDVPLDSDAREYPVGRVICDARILNIFERAAEIHAQVIARRLLEGAN